jgi:hypothetical protein
MVKTSGGRQRLLVALCAFVAALGTTIVAACASSSPGSSSRGPEAASPAPGSAAQTAPATSATPASQSRQLRIGIAYGDTLPWKSDAALARGLDDAVAVGATWVRVDLSWNDIQPDSSHVYHWQRFDRVVQAARARHLNVLPTIAYTPAWAREPGCHTQSCPPADPVRFADFAKDAAERYAPMGVHTWEIWNEPNIHNFWSPKPDPAAYTHLLRVTAHAIRAVDRKTYLLMGGLAAVNTDPKRGFTSQVGFLTAVSKLGANRLVDAVSYHPYTYPYLPGATTGFGTSFERISTTRENLAAVLDTYGTPDIPIWITETGAPTNGPGSAADGKTIPPVTTHVTEAFQAEIASATVPAAAANRHVAAVFWFADQDSGTAKDKARHSLFFGLRRYDGTAKPSFDAFKASIAAYERRQRK